jgi:hypothetical protein
MNNKRGRLAPLIKIKKKPERLIVTGTARSDDTNLGHSQLIEG